MPTTHLPATYVAPQPRNTAASPTTVATTPRMDTERLTPEPVEPPRPTGTNLPLCIYERKVAITQSRRHTAPAILNVASHEVLPRPVEPPPLATSPRESNDSDYDSAEEPDSPPPPISPQAPLPLRITGEERLTQNVTTSKEAIQRFFDTATPPKLKDGQAIQTLFDSTCTIAVPVVKEERATAETILFDYFQDHYSDAVKQYLNQEWQPQNKNNTHQITALIRNQIGTLKEGDHLPYVWIQAPFLLIKESPILTLDEKAAFHAKLRKEMKVCVLQTLTKIKKDTTEKYEELLTPNNKPALAKVLLPTLRANLKKTSDQKKQDPNSENIANFKTRMLYLFFEFFFQVTPKELLHFEGFEYDKNHPNKATLSPPMSTPARYKVTASHARGLTGIQRASAL